MKKIKLEDASKIINNIGKSNIAVIGDVMLDRYFWGSVSRVSPEAPVPVIDIEEEKFHLGGAANVASNLKSLGANVLLCGLIGDDNSGRKFTEIADGLGIDSSGLCIDKKRPTTVKTRIIGNNQQIARLDREERGTITSHEEKQIINKIKSQKDLSAIVFEDYNKGTISSILIREILSIAKKWGIQVFVDPKLDNFFDYQGVMVFKPNRKEASRALNMSLDTKKGIASAGKKLLKDLKCKNVLLTLGEGGMMLFESNGNVMSVPTLARHVADVSGAGDTAIATLCAAMSAGAPVEDAAIIANIASGKVCEEPGIVSITKEDLLEGLKHHNVQ